MNEYKRPIRISSADPLCSASALSGTIIGVLFDKKGSEIQMAIQSRQDAITGKIVEYEGAIEKARTFLDGKQEEIDSLDDYLQERADYKKEITMPFQREVDEVNNRIRDKYFEINKETEKGMAEKALVFEKGFKDLEEDFKKIDAIIDEESSDARVVKTMSSRAKGLRGPSGDKGISGNFGTSSDSPDSLLTVSNSSGQNIYMMSIDEEENRALSKLQTLKNYVSEYLRKINILNESINELREEFRRLSLMYKNIDSERMYKLDINKLSAFGFETIA